METATKQQKINKLRSESSVIDYTPLSTRAQLTDSSPLDKRIVEGYAIIWGSRNDRCEKFVKGCCAKSIKERGPESTAPLKIKFLRQHDQSDALSLFEIIKEDDIGLYFKTVPLDPVDSADRVLIQLRSKTLNNFSAGFNHVWDKIEYDDSDDSLVCLEIELYEISVVGLSSDENTYCIRSKDEYDENIANLDDEIETFIKASIPRKNQLEARSLFRRQKSLIQQEPLEQRQKALENDEPTENAIDYDYLIKNFKF